MRVIFIILFEDAQNISLARMHALIGWPWKINNVRRQAERESHKKIFNTSKRAKRKKLQSEPPKGSF